MSLVDDTVRVRRGGSYLTIPASAIDRYIDKGYDVVDRDGNIIRASIPSDLGILRASYKRHIEEIEQLKRRIAELENVTVSDTPEVKPSSNRKKKA